MPENWFGPNWPIIGSSGYQPAHGMREPTAWPHAVAAAAGRTGQAHEKEAHAGRVVCLCSPRPCWLYQLGRVSGRIKRSGRRTRRNTGVRAKGRRRAKALLCSRDEPCAAAACRLQYHERRGHLYPDYACGSEAARYGQKQCQRIPGRDLDRALGELLLATVNPLNLEVALALEQEVRTRWAEVDRLRYQVVERAQQEAELARRRYLRVDPDNRLVADQLEADWNNQLQTLRSAQEDYEQQKQNEQNLGPAGQREKILALAADFPRVWKDPHLPPRERKRMARFLLEDVTLHKTEQVIAEVRFQGGALHALELPLPWPFCVLSRTRPEVVEAIDADLGTHDDQEIADLLNARGLRSGDGRRFTVSIVGSICQKAGLRSRRQRLRDQGLLTRQELSRRLRVKDLTITQWRREGRLIGYRSNYRAEYLYVEPTPEQIVARKATR
jgi:hypothetical protein